MTPETDHLYELEPQPADDGTWTMTYVRTDRRVENDQ
ncbi:hypothetical protein H4W31_001256 [Plantactinospora soyae]|uniref:Uncharacterized protein n=1 Tax=Plantactinospora soyae TaxID=1544732 RepID=A0A927M530_9ACTN|nr:hypothetical protein [Plantactinospora soyae]